MADQHNRKFPRANYPCFLTLWQGNDFGTIMANTANIGAGGLLVYLSQGLMVGAKVEIKIDFTQDESLRCSGLVLRCQKNKEGDEETKSPYSVAIVFEGLDEGKAVFLKEIIEKLLINEGS
jgi:hypothetical protein